jgi:hypothetical protein
MTLFWAPVLARYHNPHMQRPTINTQKSVCQNVIMGQSYEPRRGDISAGRTTFDLSKYGHIIGKTLCSSPKRRPSRQAHGSTGLAPRHHVRCPWDCLGLINTSRTSLCATQQALLGVFSSRSSSVSRGVRSAFPIFSERPLVRYFVAAHKHYARASRSTNTSWDKLWVLVSYSSD